MTFKFSIPSYIQDFPGILPICPLSSTLVTIPVSTWRLDTTEALTCPLPVTVKFPFLKCRVSVSASSSSCLRGFGWWLFLAECGPSVLHTHPLPRKTDDICPSEEPAEVICLRDSQTLTGHLSNVEEALECKQTLPLPLNCLWPGFVFRKGVTVRVMCGCCTCDLPICRATEVWNVLHHCLFLNVQLLVSRTQKHTHPVYILDLPFVILCQKTTVRFKVDYNNFFTFVLILKVVANGLHVPCLKYRPP